MHIVAIFKDYLIYDDPAEFIDYYYPQAELKDRLKNIWRYYERYWKTFPNYFILDDVREVVYSNIRQKANLNNDVKIYCLFTLGYFKN